MTVDTSLAHLDHDFGITVGLLASGRLRTEPLHELAIGLDDLPDALVDQAAGRDCIKILVRSRK
ncbi:hypothetical protein [Streptomyces ipomoeae]|uniref:hypothetical protein n=1 Tax=Streptomyces ipomoeae TaxID=103232 RepID=UPI001C673E1B|nr:hypothetical protein [Streptomyces ipomoeae]MDX2939342.1 hypothetical protein [Streptomyces ipomoeae]